ncbi:DUF937 domain-containing protein [Xanthomonas campestris]|uniref:DUF937 domain-containing protein n=1 Tax=Xanthomonas campestris TaxID=339 RepID=UPI000C285C56|nr:DUF937 domain-containing protein [Xanthomonas campestris]MCD0249230.1 DUF937 domain-containing protein [Xanthomonas campestris pv. campestris]MCD0261852.1 DUF937 domain-containing protein [Xanthomonas campestris pv. campestris]MCD0270260.1 DUF937 domain-containing protein [Xanthomonas campestris pv. campestris]MCD0276724.1 DUF937 domain-containing protein [Xanthomonas campestris pv. campestris]MCF8787164.1 DUF937 domain-containing protein [Xanthomonas campestris pv. campestris]
MTTSDSLTSQLAAQLQGPQLQQLASRLGIAPEQAQSAVQTALPLLMGALGRNSQQAGGTQVLASALHRDHTAAPDLGSLLGSLLGGSASGAQANGAGIVGHLFGDKAPQAAAGLGQATGLEPSKASQLLQLLAPIVMAYLAKRFLGGGTADTSQLGNALAQEQSHVRNHSSVGGLLGSVLDQDGDGQLGLGDVMKLGGSLFGKR